jgi:hypothetical protein
MPVDTHCRDLICTKESRCSGWPCIALIIVTCLSLLLNEKAYAQFSGADSFCSEPGEATFALPAPTSTPTPIPTEVPPTQQPDLGGGASPSPTPSPAQRTTLSGVVLDQNGRPVANAIVYIFDLGITMTDANGGFSKVGADPNKEYAVAIQSIGFEGPIPPVFLRAGSGSTLRVISTPQRSVGGCKEISVKEVIADNADRVSKIFDRIVRDYDRWAEVRPADIETVVQEGMIRARHQLNQYLAASLGVPTTIRRCSGAAASQCTQISISESKRQMVRTARWMRQEALFINMALRKMRGRPPVISRFNERRIKQLGDSLAQSIGSRIPSKSYSCQ